MSINRCPHKDRLAPVSAGQVSELGSRVSERLHRLGSAFLATGNETVGSELIELAEAVAEMVTADGERMILERDDEFSRSYLGIQSLLGGIRPYRHMPAHSEAVS